MCVLLLTLGFLALGSNIGSSEAHLLGAVERGPCQAKNPLGRGFLDGTCMPLIKCKQTLRGIIRLNFPVICGFELLRPIVCCPNMGHSAHGSGGGGTGPQAPQQPLLPHGGGGSGFPIQPDSYPPVVGPQQPHGNSPGTGPVPSQPGSGGGGPAFPQGPVTPPKPTIPSGPVAPSRPVVPSGPTVPQTPVNKPAKRPAPGGGSNPPGEGADDGAPCDQPECEPGENDSYIHLINPRKGKN